MCTKEETKRGQERKLGQFLAMKHALSDISNVLSFLEFSLMSCQSVLKCLPILMITPFYHSIFPKICRIIFVTFP